MITTTNDFFRKDKTFKKKSFENDAISVTYHSTAEYYEDKCDFILKKKFPSLTKWLIRIQMIFSEMMFLIILIVQGLILVF